jgi:quercetin dioxygenase-like cupin family protein
MAKTGQEIYNPRQKDRIVFKKTARETGGELLRMELFASPNGAPPPDHVHPRQEERFETISGTLRARVGGEERTLRAGERVVVPAGVGHTFWIEGEEDAHVLVELRPARNTETFLETMYGLVSDGKADENGVLHAEQPHKVGTIAHAECLHQWTRNRDHHQPESYAQPAQRPRHPVFVHSASFPTSFLQRVNDR